MVETKRERHNRLKREWRAKNKDRYREIVKKSNLKNKDKIKERNLRYRKKNKDKIKEKYLLNREEILKQNKKYKKDNKEKIREQNKNYRLKNVDKVKAYFNVYNKKNSKKIQLRRRKNYLKNKDRTLLINKIWLQNNKEVRREQQNKYAKKRRNDGSLFKLKDVVRGRLRRFLKLKNFKKSNTTFELIGCTPEELKIHIEKQFLPGMNWDNHTNFGWHIDHIIPLSRAKNSEDLLDLAHYTNLQPMWWRENILKKNN